MAIRSSCTLVEDWHRRGVETSKWDDILRKGVSFLAAIEHKRSTAHPAEPTRTIRIAKAIISGRTANENLHLLMMHNPRSNCFQMIGGGCRPSESAELALEREINEEMPAQTLIRGTDYSIEPYSEQPSSERFVSPTHGLYTHYHVYYFYLRFFRPFSLSPGQRWISLREIQDGRTVDGIAIVPSPDILLPLLGNVKKNAPPSVLHSIDPILGLKATAAESSIRNERAVSQPTLLGGVSGVIGILMTTIGSLVLAAHFAPDFFYAILGGVLPLMVLCLAFVARASHLIGSTQMVSLFNIARKRTKARTGGSVGE